MEPTKLWINLSGHCCQKIKSLHNFEEAVKLINYASWDVNVVLSGANSKQYYLPIPALDGHLVLDSTMKHGITFVPHNAKRHSIHEHRYQQRYEFNIKLSDYFEQGQFVRIFNNDGVVQIKNDSGKNIFGKKVYDVGHGRPWTKAWGKVYPKDQESNVLYLEVNQNVDRHDMRIKLTDSRDISCGKMKTQEDVEFKRTVKS